MPIPDVYDDTRTSAGGVPGGVPGVFRCASLTAV
jgi:hypothetical protein